jgi:hypothetical protein
MQPSALPVSYMTLLCCQHLSPSNNASRIIDELQRICNEVACGVSSKALALAWRAFH